MRIGDVTVGGRYLTRVSGALVEVEVLAVREVDARGTGHPQRRAIVRRVDTGRDLPRPRPASGLHPTGATCGALARVPEIRQGRA